MARRGTRRSTAGAVDLGAAFEQLATRIGERIGAGIARALAEGTPARATLRCGHRGCSRRATATGFCVAHRR